MPIQTDRVEAAVVVGAGPAGLAAALALARFDVQVVIAAPKPTDARLAADTRTFAALGGSVDFLKALGVWSDLERQIAPLTGIRLIDGRAGVLRAPEVLFEAREAGLEAFGYNIPQAALAAALVAAAGRSTRVRWQETTAVRAITSSETDSVVAFAEGHCLRTQLVVAADGRHSIGRTAAGIETTVWEYPQTAVVCGFSHTRDHGGISTEFHGSHGPLTTVPLPAGPEGPRSSLVWVEAPDRATALQAMADAPFSEALTRGLQGLLGRITQIGPRTAFPLAGLEAKTMARHRVVLIGEAGHVLPPIGAQGLNLGLRDAATLADCVAAADPSDLGAAAVTDDYARRRGRDVWTRTRAVDLLNRSLLTSAVPLDALRGLGLHALAASSRLRRLAMRQGLEPIGERPRLMQPVQPNACWLCDGRLGVCAVVDHGGKAHGQCNVAECCDVPGRDQ
jgi:2-octaprenyl-6-methoxyphenol hydroxylase